MQCLLTILVASISLILVSGCSHRQENLEKAALPEQHFYRKDQANVPTQNPVEAGQLLGKENFILDKNKQYNTITFPVINNYSMVEDSSAILTAANQFIREHPKHKDIDYVYYIKGIINYHKHYTARYNYLPFNYSERDCTFAQSALESFTILAKKFPQSYYVSDAAIKISILHDQLAEHELHILVFLMEKGAYLPAIKRASYIIDQFHSSKSTARALSIMVQAYQNLTIDLLTNGVCTLIDQTT